ncbi:MAG: metal ABC transporter permease [Planctomycetota bacterium]|nr:metal ABC transporter permease [Planctomycetota bacterium]
MRTIEYLSGPDALLFVPAIAAGVAIALVCGVLSVFVVLRRLAFIGHGVSHAAFGGVGLAAALGLTGMAASSAAGYLAVVGAFCIAAALVIAYVSAKAKLREDTVIGVALVASLAMGALLLHQRARSGGGGVVSLEGSLFGSMLAVGWTDALAAWAAAVLVLAVLWVVRRPLVFWTFDEPAAAAFGVDTMRMRLLLMGLLGVSIVVAMKLAGVVLATALLILPGATALRLSASLGRVIAVSALASVLGVLGGLVLSFELDWPTGPSVVVALIALMIGAMVARRLSGGAGPARGTGGAVGAGS